MPNYLIALGALCLIAGCGSSPAKPSLRDPVSKELAFAGAGKLELSGTLVMPVAQRPVAAFLLIPGSGPTDRDGNSGLGFKTDILKQIADRLASVGVASFRFDKRAIGRYSGSWPKDAADQNRFFSYQNFIEDAKAAYRSLRSQPGIDPLRMGILGHSEGGLFALQIGSDLAGSAEAPYKLVLLGTAGRPLGPVIHEQILRQVSAPSVPKDLGQKLLSYSDDACAALIAGKPLPPKEPDPLKVLYNPAVIDLVTAYLRVDPVKLAMQYAGPVLIVNGQNDTQISATLDAPRLQDALKSRSGGTVKMVIVPNASHNLKSTVQAGPDAFDGPVAPEALDAIAAFVATGR